MSYIFQFPHAIPQILVDICFCAYFITQICSTNLTRSIFDNSHQLNEMRLDLLTYIVYNERASRFITCHLSGSAHCNARKTQQAKRTSHTKLPRHTHHNNSTSIHIELQQRPRGAPFTFASHMYIHSLDTQWQILCHYFIIIVTWS